MKEIYWKKLNWFEKIILCLGWLNVLSLLFWVIIMIVYYSDAYKKRKNNNKEKFEKFINPHTLKVVYVFGYLTLPFIFWIFILLILFVF